MAEQEAMFLGSDETIVTRHFEDFVMPSYSRITALNLYADTLTYSAYPDHYEYRVLVKNEEGKWVYESYGPFIDKTIEQVYVCIGIHYIDMDSNK